MRTLLRRLRRSDAARPPGPGQTLLKGLLERVLPALIIAAILGTAAWWFKPEAAWRYLGYWFVRVPPGTHFTILVANLENDPAFVNTDRLAGALHDERGGVAVIKIGRKLAFPSVGHFPEAQPELEAEGRTWLRDKSGDVLVWGRVDERKLKLRFLASSVSERGTYQFHEGIEFDLSQEFHADLVRALTLTAVHPATERQGEYLVEVLRPIAPKLERLARDVSDPAQRAQVWHAFGVAAYVIGEQSGDSAWLGKAIDAYREALRERTHEHGSREWAMTQGNLANALTALGQGESGPDHLNSAVAVFKELFQVFTREQAPLQWAMTQNNLGAVLQALGERDSGTEWMEEAVGAFREALRESTRERVPLGWAAIQNNLGTALRRLGQREADRDRAVVLLEQAVTALRAALAVFREAGAGHYIQGTEENLARAEALLAERNLTP